jgi:hypothetical protein
MRTREDLMVRLLNGKVFKKNIFTLTLENVFLEEDFLIVDAILTSENSHQPFSTTDIFIWLDSIVESYVEKIYSNTKGPSVSYLPSIKYKNGKLKTGFILLSGEIEKKLIESIEDLYRKYSPEKVSQFIDFRSVYLGVAGGDSVLCEIIMKNVDDARDFRKVFIDIKSTSTFHFDARKKLREQIDKVLELCEQNSPAETVFDLEEIKVYPR